MKVFVRRMTGGGCATGRKALYESRFMRERMPLLENSAGYMPEELRRGDRLSQNRKIV